MGLAVRASNRRGIWTPTVRDPILNAFDDAVGRDPTAALVVSRSRKTTRGEVDALARRLASVLPRSRSPVAVLAAPTGPGFLSSWVALLRAGTAPVLADPGTPIDEQRRIASRLGASFIVRCRHAWPTGIDDWSIEDLGPDAVPGYPVPPSVAAIKLTSGSSGEPRGIAATGENLLVDDEQLRRTMGIGESSRLMAAIPLSHSYGLSSLAVPALTRGIVLVIPDETGPSPGLASAAACGATFFPTVPAVIGALLRIEPAPPWPATLRLVVTAGAPIAPESAARFRETFGLPVRVFYGASEVGGICFDREGGAAERGTVGTPVEGVRVTLEREVERGDAPDEGTVVVLSRAAAAGYLPDPNEKLAGGTFRGGDVGAWRAGELALRGREDFINVKGKKVYPREVEGILAGFPGVDEVVVLGVRLNGTDGETVRAVIAGDPEKVTPAAVLEHCRGRLAPHKIPRSVVVRREIPRTERGKIDRSALAGPAPRLEERGR